jgi:PDZ domain-containing secreted protein
VPTVGLVSWGLRGGRCKEGVAVTGSMGLDGRLYRVHGFYEKIRGAAAHGVTHYVVPLDNVERSDMDVLVEWTKMDDPPAALRTRVKGGGYVAENVKVDQSSSEALRVLAAERMEDVLGLCLTGEGGRRDNSPGILVT